MHNIYIHTCIIYIYTYMYIIITYIDILNICGCILLLLQVGGWRPPQLRQGAGHPALAR